MREITARHSCGCTVTYPLTIRHGNPGPPEFDADTFVELGRRACLERGLFPSAVNVARLLGVSSRTVKRWRKGVGVRIATADRVAVNLGLHVEELAPC